MVNKERGEKKQPNTKHTDIFWQSRNKSDKKHDLWFWSLSFCFSCLSTLSHWLALIVLHSHVMPSRLPWRPRAHQLSSVQTMLLQHFSEAVIATMQWTWQEELYLKYMVIAGVPVQIWLNVIFFVCFFFVLFFIKVFLSKVVKGKLTGALVYFFLMPVKYVHFFFFKYRLK